MAQMEVSYSRRLDYQYMMIEAGEDTVSDYRLSMLIHNRIDGFLPVYLQQVNGKCTLCYDITSFEAIPSFLDARTITYDEMVSLLLQFCSAVSEVGRYLLDGEGILLEPQYIYVSKSLERVRFCYYPYQHMPLYQSVNVLCRFLIDHIDYDDRKSLELAYGLFQESLKENLSISVIVGCIKNKLEECSDKKSEIRIEDTNKDTSLEKNHTDNTDIAKDNVSQNPLNADKKNENECTDLQKSNQKMRQQRAFGAAFGTVLVIAIFGYVFFMAGHRLLQLQVINENMLMAAGILIVIVAAIAAVVAYRILKRKH